jgi:thioredoxin 1
MTGDNVVLLDEKNFDAAVTQYPGLAVVEFTSNNCVPCKQLARILSKLSSEVPSSVRIGSIEVSQNSRIAERFGIQSTPTLLFFKNGALVDTRLGVDRHQVLRKLVEAHSE